MNRKLRNNTLLNLFMVLVMLAPLSSFAAEKDLYDFLWLDQDKKVYVLQNKTYKKANTWQFDVGFIYNVTNQYQDSTGFKVALGYNWSEQWGIEAFYNSYNNSSNTTLTNLNEINTVMPFIRRMNSSAGALLRWDPFYGKINTFNKIIYFDWSFGAGLAAINTESNAKTAAVNSYADEFDKESYVGGIVKTELKVHVSKKWNIGLEYQRHLFVAPGVLRSNGDQKQRLEGNSDVVLSIGFSF